MMTEPFAHDRQTVGGLSTLDYLFWRLLIWGLGAATPLLVSLKPRNFLGSNFEVPDTPDGLSHIVTLGLYLFFLVLALLAFTRRPVDVPGRGSARAFWLLTVLLASMPLISSFVGGGTLQSGVVGTIGLYSATYFLPAPPIQWWAREVRVMLLVLFVYGSLAAALFFPDLAWNKEYDIESSVALFSMRLFGTANHANSLAPLAVFSWMLGRFPGCRLKGEHLHGAAVLIVLLFAQSKTVWAVCLLLLGLYVLARVAALRGFRKYMAFSAIGAGSCGLIFYLLKYSAYASSIEDVLEDPQVITLTGRLSAWLYAIDTWLERPWIGKGLDAWSSDVARDNMSLLGWTLPHAHNQLLQVLSESGLVGMAVLIIWAAYYIKLARGASAGLRAPLWWLSAFFFLPGFTEVVLGYNIGTGPTVLTWIIFTATLTAWKSGYGKEKRAGI